MFPDLENYNRNDIRQLILYSWHFELFALKEIIEITHNNIEENINKLLYLSHKNIGNPYHSELIMKVQEYNNIEPLTYQSYLLSLYAIVEASLDRYCKVCEEKMNLNVSLEDLKDKGITRAITYLEKVVEIENIKSDDRWNKMKLINEMRNDFIHSSGYFVKQAKIEKYKKILNIEIVDGKIYLLYEDIIKIYEIIEKFMDFVFTRNFLNPNKKLNIKDNS